MESQNYFQNDHEWRVVLEWANDTTTLIPDNERIARVGLYLPIYNNSFDVSKATTRMNAANFYKGGGSKADVIMVSYEKN